MEPKQHTTSWDDTYFVADCTPHCQSGTQGRQGLISGFFPQLRCFSQAITCLGALIESTRFHKTKLYKCKCWLCLDNYILGELCIKERAAHIEAGKNMPGVRLHG